MKIAILGKGTSSIITALTCISHGHCVEIYYDPNSPFLNVGESTTPHIASLIKECLDISIGDLINENIVSLKHGVEFDGWGLGNKFNHYFDNNFLAFHFESGDFNTFIHNILKDCGIEYHPYKIEKYDVDLNKEKIIINDNEYDHLICCSGWNVTDEYKKPIFETVNNALLYSNECFSTQPYTQHLATDDGWQFGLPFPKRNLIKHGYLFNSKFTDIEQVRKKINKENAKHISWKPKYCKKMIQNKFISYNGNRLMFLEPIQALSLYYYRQFAKYICSFIDENRHENYVKYNQLYYQDMVNYQLSIAWHYSYGSKYNSPFWDDIKQRSNNIMEMFYQTNLEYYEDALFHDKKYSTGEYFSIGCFGYGDYFQIHSGMLGEKLKFKDTYKNFL